MRASIYTLTTADSPGLLEQLVADCPVQVAESLVAAGQAKLRFRVRGDEAACDIGAQLLPGRTWALHTGVGVNHRDVTCASHEHQAKVPHELGGTGHTTAAPTGDVIMTSSTEIKHTLTADGAPFDTQGNPVNSDSSTKGEGSAKCACSWLSEVLPSRAARKTAHAEHKANPNPVTPIKEKKPVAKKTEEPAAVETDVVQDDALSVEYTKPRCFFKALGVNGAAALAGTHDSISDVTGTASDQLVHISGNEGDRNAVAAALPAMWDAAYEAFKVWKRENKADRKGGRDTAEGRKALYDAECDFLTSFCEKYATESVL